jgi:hypothetical protein
MAKAILIMDMPSSCVNCDFFDLRHKYCNVIWFGKDVGNYVKCRHEYCPLREVKKEIDTNKVPYDADYYSYHLGYNACIDEILGGVE